MTIGSIIYQRGAPAATPDSRAARRSALRAAMQILDPDIILEAASVIGADAGEVAHFLLDVGGEDIDDEQIEAAIVYVRERRSKALQLALLGIIVTIQLPGFRMALADESNAELMERTLQDAGMLGHGDD